MSTELGKAYVQIMPSAKGISGSIQKQLAPEATAAGRSAGKNIASAVANSMSNVGGALTKAITVPALGAATAISGIIGAMGFKRLVGIDTAQAKLKGLGHDAKSVEAIMDSALDAVRGTAYGLDEAATSAANAVAAGISPGQDLTKYLGLAGDAAAIAGSSMGEMGSIFGKVQTAQKAYTGELNQLADRGIPIFQWLAEEAGTTAEGVREMASDGAISSEMFLAAIESNIGGAAKTMGEESFTAGLANIGAAIGRVGAEFLDAGGKGGGFFSSVKPLTSELIGVIDNLSVNAADLGVKFGEAFTSIVDKIRGAVQWWTSLEGSTQKLILTFAGIAVAIGPTLLIMGKIIGTLTTMIGTIATVSKGIAALKGGFLAAQAGGVVASGAMAKLGGAIAALLGPVGLIIGVIAGLIAIFVALYNENERFREIVGLVWEEIKNVIQTVVGAVSDFVMGIVGGLVDWWQENQELIMETARVVWETIQNVIVAVLDFLLPVIKTAWEGIKNNIAAAWDLITTIVKTGINFVKGIIKAVMQMITGDWSGAWQTIKSTVSGLITGIKDIISKQINLAFTIIRGVLDNIKAKFSAIFNPLKNIVGTAFTAVKNSIKRGMDTAYNTVTNFFGKFKEAGKKIVTSIADGIKGAVGKATGAIGSVAGKIRNFLPFSPPKEGPLMDIMDVEWGKTIGAGIESGESEVAKAMDNMLDFDLTKRATFNDPNTNNHGTNDNRVVNITVDASNLNELQQVIEIFTGLKQTVRQG